MRLKDKIAVVTGGNSGIGLATAKRFQDEGATVIITGRRADALEDAVEQLDGKATAIQGDVSKADDLDRLVHTVKETFGRIDVLFVNAGVAKFAPLGDSTPELYDQLFGINVKGAYFTVQKAAPIVSDGGSIILNTSVAGQMGLADASLYSATKAALRSFARTLASELAERKIRVNAIAPGPIETPLYQKLGMPQEEVDAFGAHISEQVPLKRFGQAAELASVAAFLASDDASYVTGTELVADGGLSQV